ncbi:DJ-1 family glyoxalase III [Muribaculum intestinale]|uniref:DJ-1 family glyoxalase III n=2 Tax=Muribaculum intestinale TaxID=1796646 RepID=UPI0025A61D31|nr:DJ-1 family glyoxalase III [Muribaculum intestinale]
MTETSIRIPASSRPSGKATFVMLGNGFDEIEALAPVDVMRRAGMEVFTVSMTDKRLVRGATGNNIVADMGISDLNPEQIDWLVFPGADKSEDAVNLDESLNDIVKDHWDKGGNIAAICAAPALILGPLGIIKGVKATGYPFLKKDLERNGGIYSEEPVVIGDRMITSKGPGTTLEFALAIVRKAKGPETEKALREGMVIPKCG